MATVTIRLSASQAKYISAQVQARGLKSADEYVSQLILLDHLKANQSVIDGLLLDGLRDPYSDLTDQDIRDIEREGLEKLAEEKSNGRKTPKKQQRSKRPA